MPTSIDNLQQQLDHLVDCIHTYYRKGWAPATSTNYSIRMNPSAEILISASGLDKGKIKESDFLSIDGQGELAPSESRKPSAETALHLLIYRLRPEMTCVLHTHSSYATALSYIYRKKEALEINGLEVQKGIEGYTSHEQTVRIPIFENAQDMYALSHRIESFDSNDQQKMPAFLLAGHGLYTWGTSITQANRHLEAIEFLLECYYKIHTFPVIHR